jgi:hypothetical protein
MVPPESVTLGPPLAAVTVPPQFVMPFARAALVIAAG